MAQNLLDSDSFGGTNGNTLTTYDANWVLLDLTNIDNLDIRGTPGVGGAGASLIGGELRNGQTWTNDHWAELKIDGTTVADVRFLVGVRCTQGVSDSMTGYFGGVHRDDTGGDYKIYKFSTTSAYTAIATGTHTYAANDVVNIQAVGTTITLTLNGVTEATASSQTDYATGSPGMILSHSTTARLAGTWNAGSVGTAATAGGPLAGGKLAGGFLAGGRLAH